VGQLLTDFVLFNDCVEVFFDFGDIAATLDPLHIVVDVLLLLFHVLVQLALMLPNVVCLYL
jgi:hypothetical protein